MQWHVKMLELIYYLFSTSDHATPAGGAEATMLFTSASFTAQRRESVAGFGRTIPQNLTSP